LGENRIVLLGVLYAGSPLNAIREIIKTPNLQRPIARSQIPVKLGLIIKSERIIETDKLFK
jgi:hypothetical protein